MILLKKYKKNIYVARGNTTIYKSHFKGLGFRWSKKIKGGPGYTIRLYNTKHLKTIYDKLKTITDGDVCLLSNEDTETKKRCSSSLLKDNKKEVVYPNKKVCSINHNEFSEIQGWKDALFTVCTSFPFQVTFVSIYLKFLYPNYISPGVQYVCSDDFSNKIYDFWNSTITEIFQNYNQTLI